MARLSNRSRIEQLTDAWEPVIRLAFIEAVRDLTSRAELGRIVERLERGDIAGAIEAVHLDPAAFRTLDNAIAQAFDAGGSSTIGALPVLRDPSGARFVVRWDARNVRAETWLREHSSTLITRITDDQRAMVRQALVDGLAAGRNPKSVALDLVGRVGASGTRQGGLIGLTAQQSTAVANARAGLLSGDPVAMRAYLKLGRRDHRFDGAVEKAIAAGKPVDAATVSRIVGRYSDRLLQLRGEVIAQLETRAAIGQSHIDAMDQAAASGALDRATVTDTWHTAKDPKVRDSHAAQDGFVVPMNGVFPNGQRYPGDPSAGPEESIGCRCWKETRVDFFAGLR